MRRRTVTTIVCLVAAALAASGLDAIASGPGFFRPRNKSSGTTSTRSYRSYSVSPGTSADSEGVAADGEAFAVRGRPSPSSAPAPAASFPSPSRPAKAKPSYMRADSKAMGRYGQ